MKKDTNTIETESKDNYLPVEEYLSMPYKKVVYKTNDTGKSAYFAEIIELDSCFSEGSSEVDALKNLNNAFRAYINLAKKKGVPIPMPFATSDYNGKVLVRMPSSLHQKLRMIAKCEGVSLNQYIVSTIYAGMYR